MNFDFFKINRKENQIETKTLSNNKEDKEVSCVNENIFFDETMVDSSEWEAIDIKEDSSIFSLDNGIKIENDNEENLKNIQIYENTQTGEVIIVGANDVSITSKADDVKLSIYDSDINEINTSKGNDEINLFNSEVDKLLTGRGIDDITIDSSEIGTIRTGSGADNVNVKNSKALNLKTNGGEDNVNIVNSEIKKVKTGGKKDTVITTNSDIESLKTGTKADSVSLNNTEIENLKTNKKDLVVKNGNYLDFDKSKITNINSTVQIQLQDGTSIKVEDYVNSMLNQEVGFETEEEYQQYTLETLTNNLETMKSVFQNQNAKDGAVSDTYNSLKDLTGLGISDEDINAMISKQEEMINGLTATLNGESDMTFEEAYEYYTGTTYSQEKIDKYLEVSNTYSAVMTACQYDEDYAKKFEEATGTSIENLAKEYGLCQVETFGKSTTLENLSELYSQDQEAFTEKLSVAVSTVGMACIVTGAVISFVFPPAAGAGMALMTAGKFIAPTGMLIDNGLDLIDHTTDADGLTKDETKELALETGVEVVSYATGRAIGKATNLLNSNITNKLTSEGMNKLGAMALGQTAETTADAALSLTADYAIAQGQSFIATGEFMDTDDYWSMDRFLGEGKNQLIGILTGVASSKVNAYQQATITGAQTKILAGDIDGAKTDLIKSGMKMTDAQFEEFTNNVKAVQTGELTVPIESETNTETNTKAVGGEEKETTITENNETSSSPLKIDLQLFADGKTKSETDEILVSKSNDFIKNLLNGDEKIHGTYIKDTDANCIRTKIGLPIAGFKDLYDTNKHILVCFDKNNEISNAFQYNQKTKEIDVYSSDGKLTHHYTKEDYDALHYYKYHPDSIHSKLRYGKDMFGGSFLEETNQAISQLNKLFADDSKVFRTTENQTLYRALQSNLSEEEITALTTIGGTYTDKSFCSTTEKLETAQRFSSGNPILKINVPEDTKYIDVEKLFNIDREHWSEQELLLDKNSQFVVKSFDVENNIIEVDLVQPKGTETKVVGSEKKEATKTDETFSTNLKPNIQLFAESKTEPLTQDVIKSRIKTLIDKGVNPDYAKIIVCNNDYSYSRFETLIDLGFKTHEACIYSNIVDYNDETFSKILNLVNSKNYSRPLSYDERSVIIDFYDLFDTVERVQKMIDINDKDYGFDLIETVVLSTNNLTDAQIEKFINLRKTETDQEFDDLLCLVKNNFTDAQIEKFINLRKTETDKTFDEVLYLAKNDIPPEDYEQTIIDRRIKTLSTNKNIDEDDINAFAEIKDPENYSRIESLVVKGISDGTTAYLIAKNKSIEDSQLSRIETALEAGVDINNFSLAQKIAFYEDTETFTNFITLLKSGLSEYDAEKFAKLDETQYQKFCELTEKNINPNIAKEIITYEEEEITKIEYLLDNGINFFFAKTAVLNNETSFSKIDYLLKKGVAASEIERFSQDAYLLQTNEKTFKKLSDFLSENETKDFEIEIIKLQNYAGNLIKLTKEFNINETNIKIEKTINYQTGEEITTRTETYKDGTIHTYNKFSDRVLDISKNENNELTNQIEIINGSNGEPAEIIHTKASNLLEGAFETTKYTLSDYPEDMDILKAIENGTISGGEKLSTVIKNKDGSTTYKESFEHNDCTTVRDYNILKDENGNKISECYKYNITDKNGNILLNIDREFVLNPDSSSTTTINGVKYTSTFDEENKIITVINPNGDETRINIENKFNYVTKEQKEILWNLFKESPADTLLTLEGNIRTINFVTTLKSSINSCNKILNIGNDLATLNHELGHAKDDHNYIVLSKNTELINIYNEEMAILKENYPSEIESFIKYFGQEGGQFGVDLGINEFIAETNAILGIYGNKTEGVKTRAMILTKYFPQTIAKISELLNET